MHALIYVVHPKCIISNRFNIPAFCNPDAHSCSSSRISLVSGMLLVRKYYSMYNAENLCASVISCSINNRLEIFPNISSSLLTPFGTGAIDNGYFPLTGTMIGGALPIYDGR
jgi:hypothetical protein